MKRASQTTGQALSSSRVLTHQVLLLLYWSFPNLLMRDRSKMCNRDDALIHCLLRVMERNYLNNRTGSLIWYKHCLEHGKRNTWYCNEYKRKSLNEEDVPQILRFAKSRRRKDGENTGRDILSILHLHVLFQFVRYYSYHLHLYLFMVCVW